MNRLKKKTVFVGLSGGVDSAVSAALLKEEGFEVVGVFIKTWHPDFLECNEEEERQDAMRVAAHLDIPFLTFDFEDVYKKEVADYMIREYKAGRTPNPDVMCNKEVKFGAFLKKALSMGADYVATGHYSTNRSADKTFSQVFGSLAQDFLKERAQPDHSKKHYLLRGEDSAKDQSYFLWTLNQKQLSKILFPIGHLKKTEVRKLALKFKLPVAEKKDSQGICFLGAVDLKDFLKHYIREKKGKVCDTEGKVIGWHTGAVFYTLGERHGFTITKKNPNDGRYYIVGKDVKKNILVVSQDKNFPSDIPSGITREKAKRYSTILTNYRIENTNWISEVPDEKRRYLAQIRYHGELLPCRVKMCQGRSLTNVSRTVLDSTEVIFERPVMAASGQSCVVYDGDVCLGGGVVV